LSGIDGNTSTACERSPFSVAGPITHALNNACELVSHDNRSLGILAARAAMTESVQVRSADPDNLNAYQRFARSRFAGMRHTVNSQVARTMQSSRWDKLSCHSVLRPESL